MSNHPFDEPDNCDSLNKCWMRFFDWYKSQKEGLQFFIGRTGNRITSFWLTFRKKW